MSNNYNINDTEAHEDYCNREDKEIITPSLVELIFEIERLVEAGWRVNKDYVPDMLGYQYVVHMFKTKRTMTFLQNRLERAIEDRAPMTQQESMAKARAARKTAKGT